MRKVFALVRAAALSSASYRLRMTISVAGLVLSIIPLYFVTDALQGTMEERIRTEADQYFAFVLIGMIAFSFVSTAVNAFPARIGSGITTGVLEALLSTRSRLHEILSGLTGWEFLWTALRGVVLLVAGWFLGANITWGQWPPAVLVTTGIVVSTIPFGIFAAALMLAFRTAGPFPQLVIFLSGALGGVYYPTHVIPSWIQDISDFIPLTYGLRALRRVLLNGESLLAVSGDLAILTAFTVVLATVSGVTFWAAFRYARRAGTITQY
jgi:ABC-2 type transport system permease protein